MSAESNPSVTIGLPVYNGERFVESALESILVQSYQDFELVISDNASTDNTPHILQQWAAKDPRIRLFQNSTNFGAAANFNKVLSLARGKYFRWAGHDDVLRLHMLKECVQTLETKSQCVLVYPQTITIDASGNEIGGHDNQLDMRQPDPVARLQHFLRNIRWANPMFGLMRTQSIRDVGGLPSYNSGDFVMLAGLTLRGSFIELPEPLFLRRVHPGMSRKAASDPEAVTTWFDSGVSPFMVFPTWRLLREFLNEVSRSPLSQEDKRRATAVVLKEWPRRHHRRLRREVVRIPRVLAKRILIRG